MDIIEKGLEFEQRKHKFVTTSDRILEIGRAHVRTPVTRGSRMPSSA